MKGIDYNRFFNILELPSNASFQEVEKAYSFLKELYSTEVTESIVLLSVADEISKERKKEILSQIEEAYQNLLILFNKNKDNIKDRPKLEKRPSCFDRKLLKNLPEIATFNGRILRQIRESLKVNLHDIAQATRIPIKQLENIEMERFSALPPRTYSRGFVANYAKYLSLDYKKVVDDYMARYVAWEKENKK